MSWKNAFFNEDEKVNPEPAPLPMTPTKSMAVPEPLSMPEVPTILLVGAANTFLDRLKSKTDFDATPVGQQIKEHMVPLDGLPLTDAQKMSAVLKAGVKDGLTADTIVSTLQGLLAVLDQDKVSFQAALDAATKKEVDARKADIDAEAAHAKDLEEQLKESHLKQSSVSSELITAQGNIGSKAAQYQAAHDSRQAELQAQIDHYTTILKG